MSDTPCTRCECGGCERCRQYRSLSFRAAESLANRLMVELRSCTPSERRGILRDLRGPYCDDCGEPRGCGCEVRGG